MAEDGVTVTYYLAHPSVQSFMPDLARSGWYYVWDREGQRTSLPFSLLKALWFRAAIVVRGYAGRLTMGELIEDLDDGMVIGDYAIARISDLRTMINPPPASGPGATAARR